VLYVVDKEWRINVFYFIDLITILYCCCNMTLKKQFDRGSRLRRAFKMPLFPAALSSSAWGTPSCSKVRLYTYIYNPKSSRSTDTVGCAWKTSKGRNPEGILITCAGPLGGRGAEAPQSSPYF